MPVAYKHKQIGTWIICLFLAFFVIIALKTYNSEKPFEFAIALSISALALASFYSLCVEISDDFLRIKFGIGLFRKKFRLNEIAKVYPVRNKWYYGWGIRFTPHGWLFNISGLDAVEIVLKSGKLYRIGTDEPAELVNAVERYINI